MPSKYLNDARTGELIQKIYTADRAIATECKSYTDTNYLPLTGGTITGNLTVSGTITGDVTGDVTGDLTGNADSATNDANGNPIASTYLPLSGGTMNGRINVAGYSSIGLTDDDSGILIVGGTGDHFRGASLQLFGRSQSSYAGRFYIRASTKTGASDTGNQLCDLVGYPSGRLLWGDKEVERVNASGTNYIRYESGLQLVFDKIGLSGASSYTKTYTYPVAFVGNVTIVTGNRWASSNEQVSIQNDSTTKFDAYVTNAGSNSHNMFFISIGRWK